MSLPLPLTLAPVGLTSVTVGPTDAVLIGVVIARIKKQVIRMTRLLRTARAVVTKAVFQSFRLDELGEQKVLLGNCVTT